jgi:hypothetical protein
MEISRPSGTSVVGRLRGGRPGPTVAIRADFDALPILEETGLPFASVNPGVMHACGHDGHTSILLGTATVLSELREELGGEVRFLFENGEEALPGGAAGMVRGGAMEGVDRVIGLHLWAPEEIGTLIINPGRMMASCDVFTIEVQGRPGHIGTPPHGDRSDSDRRAGRHEPAAPRRTGSRPGGTGGRRRDRDTRRRFRRRDSGDRDDRRGYEHVRPRRPRPARAADRRDRDRDLRRARCNLRIRVRPRL